MDFNKAKRKASALLNDKKALSNIFSQAINKIKNIEAKGALKTTIAKLQVLLKMLKAYIRGEYKEIPWKSLLLITAAVVYFVSPLDAIPDFIPVTGLIDDASIIVWVFSSLKDDIMRFQTWQIEQNPA